MPKKRKEQEPRPLRTKNRAGFKGGRPEVNRPAEGKAFEVYKKKNGSWTVMLHRVVRDLTEEQKDHLIGEFKKEK